MDHPHQHDTEGSSPRRSKWVLAGFLLIAGFFLWTEHRAHLLGILPYVLLAACPLMHLFHHGHGHGHHRSGTPDTADAGRNAQEAAEKR